MKPSPLVVVDRTLLWALTIWYAVFTAWGFASFTFGIVTVQVTTGNFVASIYSLIIALASLSILGLPLRETHRAEVIEKYLTPVWLAFVSIWPVSLIVQLFTQPDQSGRIQLFVLALTLLVFPVWRFLFLIRKHRPNVE